ncbi:unnamed protein product [Rhizophagus irregularis]|nr:unnamed protein product [Rhizophagus irregularis]
MVNNKSKPGCKQNGQRAYIGILQSHLANECTNCPEEIQNYWLGFIAAKDSLDDDDSASIASSTGFNKKRKVTFNNHETATKILTACNSITKYFKASHICNSLLSESTKSLKIEGDGLKCFIKTRWTFIYKATYSFVRMRRALDEVVTNNPEEITNSTVKKYLKKQDFYDKINTLVKLLRPIKNAILMLEGNQTNLADAFIQMVRLSYVITSGNLFRRNLV